MLAYIKGNDVYIASDQRVTMRNTENGKQTHYDTQKIIFINDKILMCYVGDWTLRDKLLDKLNLKNELLMSININEFLSL